MEYFAPALFEVLRCKVLLSLLILLKAGENITHKRRNMEFSSYNVQQLWNGLEIGTD